MLSLSLGWVKSKVVFAASRLCMQHLGEREYIRWLGIEKMCPSGATYLLVNCFSELAVQGRYYHLIKM